MAILNKDTSIGDILDVYDRLNSISGAANVNTLIQLIRSLYPDYTIFGTTGDVDYLLNDDNTESTLSNYFSTSNKKAIFMSGVYKISSKLPISSDTTIIGIGDVKFVRTTISKDISIPIPSSTEYCGLLYINQVSNIIINNISFQYDIGNIVNKDSIRMTGILIGNEDKTGMTSQIQINNCKFLRNDNNSGTRDYACGICAFGAYSIYISNCYANVDWNAIEIRECTNVIINNVTINEFDNESSNYGNNYYTSDGIVIYSRSSSFSDNSCIRDCIINSCQIGIHIDFSNTNSEDHSVINNIFSNCSSGIIYGDGANILITGNVCIGCDTEYRSSSTGENVIVSNNN